MHGVSRATRDALAVYVDMLRRWNETVNLASPAFLRRIDDEVKGAVALAQHMPSYVQRALDIGSGNGFPAIPLCIATSVEFHLVEADRRKAAFLIEVARRTSAPIHVHCMRLDELPKRDYDVITARAFASLCRLASLAAPYSTSQTVCIFPKGAAGQREIEQLRRRWSFDARVEATGLGHAVILRNLVEHASAP